MKIEIWSDFVCPLCYIGKRRLEKALEYFPHKEAVFIEYKSYMVEPNTAQTLMNNDDEMLAELKDVLSGMPLENLENVNTFDAHRLVYHAKKYEKATDLVERFMAASCREAVKLSDPETLLRLVSEAGLDTDEVRKVLHSKKYTSRVNEDIDIANQLNVETVPFFVFNEEYAIPGVQTVEVFRMAIEKVWEEEQKTPMLQSEGKPIARTTYCTGEDCH